MPTNINEQRRTIVFDSPALGQEEKDFLIKAIESGYVSSAGQSVKEFEDKFANYLQAAGAVSTQNGTAAIHIALYELGVGPGDEVIVPNLTFVASVNPVKYVGATPVFVDVDPKTWNLDLGQLRMRLSSKTKAIIPVHLYGNPCAMDEIMAIAREKKLFVIEDATESLGAKFAQRYTGCFGDMGCFSFNGNKVITTGSGGMVVGGNTKRLEHIKYLVNQARDDSQNYYHSEIGFNYRMTNLEAALGLSQLGKLDEFLKKKRLFNDIYRRNLGDLKKISFQESHPKSQSSWWLTAVLFEDSIDIAALQKELQGKGVPTRRIFTPITEFPPYQPYKKGKYPNASRIHEHGLCLPNSTVNSAEDIEYVCDAIQGVLCDR